MSSHHEAYGHRATTTTNNGWQEIHCKLVKSPRGLTNFLTNWYGDGKFSVEVSTFLTMQCCCNLEASMDVKSLAKCTILAKSYLRHSIDPSKCILHQSTETIRCGEYGLLLDAYVEGLVSNSMIEEST